MTGTEAAVLSFRFELCAIRIQSSRNEQREKMEVESLKN